MSDKRKVKIDKEYVEKKARYVKWGKWEKFSLNEAEKFITQIIRDVKSGK